MKRWSLLLAGAALWLFLAAAPALADGGPHVADANSGVSTLTADSCAGCHRAHTAEGPLLINATSEEELCLTCHGAASSGATTDVMTGVQYVPGTTYVRDGDFVNGDWVNGTQLGALRSGGFDQARIASSTAARVFRTGSALNPWGKVTVGTAEPVTSSHIAMAAGLTLPGVAWGNGANGSGAGPAVADLSCANCHNVHGNKQYRILNPIPEADGAGFVAVTAAANVTDSNPDPDGDASFPTKNYTVIQVRGTEGVPSTYLLYASQVSAGGYAATAGDYWHLRVPWNQASGHPDAPNGIPFPTLANEAFEVEMTAWCSSCHTRYYSTSARRPTPDPIYRYRHQTVDVACTTCHVAHGSNARMEGPFSRTQPYPDGTLVSYEIGANPTGNSRLLKVDGRGTCQMCHDPTETITQNQYTGPVPTPGVP